MGRPRHSVAEAERLTIRLAPELAERLRVLAARQKVAMSAIAEVAIAGYLDRTEAKWERRDATSKRGMECHRPNEIKGLQWTPEAVREELSNLGLRQADLARAMQVAPALLSLWLSRRGIPAHRQNAISRALARMRSGV